MDTPHFHKAIHCFCWRRRVSRGTGLDLAPQWILTRFAVGYSTNTVPNWLQLQKDLVAVYQTKRDSLRKFFWQKNAAESASRRLLAIGHRGEGLRPWEAAEHGSAQSSVWDGKSICNIPPSAPAARCLDSYCSSSTPRSGPWPEGLCASHSRVRSRPCECVATALLYVEKP